MWLPVQFTCPKPDYIGCKPVSNCKRSFGCQPTCQKLPATLLSFKLETLIWLYYIFSDATTGCGKAFQECWLLNVVLDVSLITQSVDTNKDMKEAANIVQTRCAPDNKPCIHTTDVLANGWVMFLMVKAIKSKIHCIQLILRVHVIHGGQQWEAVGPSVNG